MSYIERQLADLRERYGQRWQLWFVPGATRPGTWCARLHSDHRRVLNADTPGQLEQEIKEAERQL